MRIACPENDEYVSITDRDLIDSIRFLISISTILEMLTRDLIASHSPIVDYNKYALKIKQYRPVYDSIFEHFTDEVFGEYLNKVQRDALHHYMAVSGWMYFSVKDLNMFFTIMYRKLGDDAID